MKKLTNTLRATALTLATACVAFASGCASVKPAVVHEEVVAANKNKVMYARVGEIVSGPDKNKRICEFAKKDYRLLEHCNTRKIEENDYFGALLYVTPNTGLGAGIVIAPKSASVSTNDIVKMMNPVVVGSQRDQALRFDFVEIAARANDKSRSKDCFFDNGMMWKGIKCDGWDTFKQGEWLMDAWDFDKPTAKELEEIRKQRDAQMANR